MKKVNVLIPTYNGSKYLRCQLDSLVNQTYKNLDVYTRDDGSSDDTKKIIEEYANKEIEGIRFHIIDSKGKNLGYPDCFWELLKLSEPADYYSFCDQDDWWEEDKIERAITLMEKQDEKIPMLCFCAFDYYNQRMEFVRPGERYQQEEIQFIKGMYYTFAPGFTQVINKALVEQLDIDFIMGKGLAHDLWCQWIASACGKLLFDEKVSAKYRRHESAVTAANVSRIQLAQRWCKKEIFGDEIIKWKRSLVYFKQKYYDKVSADNKEILDLFGDEKKSFVKTVKKTFYNNRLRPTKGGDLALRVLFLLQKC